jgi:hypothetical protein
MGLPPLLILPGQVEYRAYFASRFCQNPVITFDGIRVRFFASAFNHAFFRDSSRTAHDKANFDRQRAERMNWIRAVLEEPQMALYRRIMGNSKVRRIALDLGTRYAAIIQIDDSSPGRARFITAYIVDSPRALARMTLNPRW